MTSSPGAPPVVARIRDYWLGGCHSTERDRDSADQVAMCAPFIPYLVRAERALLARMVRYLLGQGVRQFLDLGAGIPTLGHVHEVVRDAGASARVVYVDNEPGVAADGGVLLGDVADADYLHADLRDPVGVLTAARLDPAAPTALLVIDTWQHVSDADQPLALIAAYREALAAGSFVAMTHFGPDAQVDRAFELFAQMNFGPRPDVWLRDRAAFERFFAGLELVAPGLVPMPLWCPEANGADAVRNPERIPILAGIGRKP